MQPTVNTNAVQIPIRKLQQRAGISFGPGDDGEI